MYMTTEKAAEIEPPSTIAPDDASNAELVDRVMAVSHLPAAAHVAVIGRNTLPLILALMRRGCGCVRSLRPGAPSPDCEAADLAWIVDVRDESELDDALRAARFRAGARGRVVVEGADVPLAQRAERDPRPCRDRRPRCRVVRSHGGPSCPG